MHGYQITKITEFIFWELAPKKSIDAAIEQLIQ